LGDEPLVHLPRWLFLKMLAYRLQTATCGDIDKVTRRTMAQEGLQLGIGLSIGFMSGL
jgi:Xaa-Pro aminopeptidase